MKHKPFIRTVKRFVVASSIVGALSVITACGSGGGDAATDQATINGYVVAAPVDGAIVRIKDISGNILVESVKTKNDGAYSAVIEVTLPAAYVVEATGGSYVDEATGLSTTVGIMRAYVDGAKMTAGRQVHVTPASTMIHAMVADHGVTLATALADFESAFGFSADADIVPADATNPAVDASNDEMLAGLRIAAFSQLTKDLGLSQDKQFELVAALAEDLADGKLDGSGAAGMIVMLPEDIAARFSQSMVAFHESEMNKTGLANDQIGAIPFSKVVLTDTYKIEYIPGMMKAMEGKTEFKLTITDRNTGAGEPGLTVALMAIMHMSGHAHSTPDVDCSDAGTGDYNCTVYYLMPSSMDGGMSMGYWELEIKPTMTESAVIYPQVMMAMGDTVKTKLKGQADKIKDMMGMDVSRNYFIFKDSLTSTGTMGEYNLTLFIAAGESMMSFPALIDGNTLMSGMGGTPLVVSGVMVDISVNGTPVAYATDNGDGTWTVNVTMNIGEVNQVEVMLSVSGERKTSDSTAGGANAVFMLTPGSM